MAWIEEPEYNEEGGDNIMKFLIGGIILLVVGLIVFAIVHAAQHPCIQSHKETVHHASYIEDQIHYVGSHRVHIPVYHAAYDSLETVCDKYK